MAIIIIITLFLNTAFIVALRHLDINHHLIRLGQKQTRGVFKVPPETSYRVFVYCLVATLFLLDLVILYLLFS